MVETKMLFANDQIVVARNSRSRYISYGYSSILERKLRESEKWQAAVLNSIGDAVIATDEKGIIKFINPFAEALTGWGKDDSVGKPLKLIFKVINEKTGKDAENPVIKVIREGAFFGLSEQTALITRGGMEIPVDIIGTPVLDDWNRIMGIIIIFYETLERKKLESVFFADESAYVKMLFESEKIQQKMLADFI